MSKRPWRFRRTMHGLAVAAAFGSLPGPAAADHPPHRCRDLAQATQQLSMPLTLLIELVEKPLVPVVPEADEELKRAANGADEARKDLEEPLRRFRDSMDDLAYQLRRCARG